MNIKIIKMNISFGWIFILAFIWKIIQMIIWRFFEVRQNPNRKSYLAPAPYSRWLALPIYGQTCKSETTPLFGDTDRATYFLQVNEIGNPISYEIWFLISFEFWVKRKQDRKSYLVRDRIFNLIWSTIEK